MVVAQEASSSSIAVASGLLAAAPISIASPAAALAFAPSLLAASS